MAKTNLGQNFLQKNAASLAAIFISVLALIVSIWSGVETRNHNRISVKPSLVVMPALEGVGGRNGLYISNLGLGPGVVGEVDVLVGGKAFNLNQDSWPDILNQLNLDSDCFSHSWFPLGSIIYTGAEKPLLTLTKAKSPLCLRDVAQMVTDERISLNLHYESLYGDKALLVDYPKISIELLKRNRILRTLLE